jgi:hypothetical protein
MTVDVGAYVVSDGVAKILAELETLPSMEDPFEEMEAHIDAYRKALAKIRELAKRDLRVR